MKIAEKAIGTFYKGLTFWYSQCEYFSQSPVGGRGHETYGEDPYLTGELAVEFIQWNSGRG